LDDGRPAHCSVDGWWLDFDRYPGPPEPRSGLPWSDLNSDPLEDVFEHIKKLVQAYGTSLRDAADSMNAAFGGHTHLHATLDEIHSKPTPEPKSIVPKIPKHVGPRLKRKFDRKGRRL
jgi:hypothetical protein